MTARRLPFESAAHDAVLRGATARANAVRLALENAVSMASTRLLAEATHADLPEPRGERVPAGPGM